MPDLSSLTGAECAVLHEIDRQWSGCAFVSYAWLKMCTEPEAKATRPEYPVSGRQLNRAVTQLIERGFIVRFRTQDRGSYHGLAETWNRLSAEIQSGVVLRASVARGSKADAPILVLGPAALPEDLRKKVWRKLLGTGTPGAAFELRGLKLGQRLHRVNLGPPPQTIPASRVRVSSEARLVEMVLTDPRK